MKIENILERIDKLKEDKNILNKLKKSCKPIIVYGCSDYSEIIYRYLKENEIEIDGFVVDKQYWKENMYIDTKRVECISDYDIEKYNVVIGFGDVGKSKFIMDSENLLKSKFYFLWNPVKYYEWDEEYVRKNWDLLLGVYEGVADNKSRKTLFELILAKLNKYCSRGLLEAADTNRHYFNDLTFCNDAENEVYLDCGAYTGDTIFQYAEFTDMKYKKIYAFEPCKDFVEDLKENVEKLKNIEIFNKGAWKEETILSFESNGEVSYVFDGAGENSVQVTTIDKVIPKDEKVTFIKMDIEGSELEALQGACKTIRRNMPKMAICCYHKKNDLISLFYYIKKFESVEEKYNIYIRHHSNNACETILYAIPYKKKRRTNKD